MHVSADYQPMGDQPRAIEEITEAVNRDDRYTTLLGATGTGKTHTVARVIERVEKPTLVIAHNKTLAAQLCNEFREYFPHNAVEYFVSYYDYYQPEAYLPASDTYIEKDSSVNDDIDRLRHAATAALFTRRDVVIVASVSCIYGMGSPASYERMVLFLAMGEEHPRAGDPREAGGDPVPAQRRAAGPRQDARARRRDRGAAGQHGVGVPDQPVRRRGRVDHPLRPTDRRDATASSTTWPSTRPLTTRWSGSRSRPAVGAIGEELAGRLAELEADGQDAGGAPAAQPHRVRHGDAAGDGLLQRHRELLADPRGPVAGHPAAHAARLLPRRLPDRDRRVAPDGAADRRHVRGRPVAQADARRARVPAALGAGQPPAAVRRVPRPRPAGAVRLGDARLVRAAPLDARGRADHPAHRPDRPGGRGAPDQASDRRSAGRDPRAGRRERADAGDDADQEDVGGPDGLPAGGGRPHALPALRGGHAGADQDHPRAAAGRVRRAGRRQPAARGPRPAGGVAGGDPGRGQGGLPPRPDRADPDDRPGGPQRQRPGADVRRQDHRGDPRRARRDQPPPRPPARVQRGARDPAGVDPQGRLRHRRVPVGWSSRRCPASAAAASRPRA